LERQNAATLPQQKAEADLEKVNPRGLKVTTSSKPNPRMKKGHFKGQKGDVGLPATGVRSTEYIL